MAKKNRPLTVKTHFEYYFWVYLLIALAGWFVGDLAYTMTEYRPPAERKVEFQLVQSGYVAVEDFEATLAPALLAAGQSYDETLEAVDFFHIAYSGDATKDVYGAQKYSVMLAAGQGDIWIVDSNQFQQLWQMGGLKPLDEYVAAGLLSTEGMDLSGTMLPETTGETDEEGVPLPATGPDRLYGIPVRGNPWLESAGFDTADCCAVLMHFSVNPETCARVLGALIALPFKEAPA